MKQICSIHRFSYSGNKCPFCEKERIDNLAKRYNVDVIDHAELLKSDLKQPTKEDLEITEAKLKELVNKFNIKWK